MSIPGNSNSLLLTTTAETGYQVSRSLRFNSSDSASCSRSFTSAGNRRTWTLSLWVKRSAIGFSAEQHIWGVTGTTDATYGEMFFGTGDTLRFAVGYNTTYGITTTRVFRDPSAWYHVVLAFDATQSTAANKIKLYINNVEETTFSSDTRSSLANQDWGYNNNVAHYIGRNPNSDIRQFNGYLADIHFIDGQALTPSSFTEVSATTGQLIPKAYTGTFGTNGFWLKFSDNSAATATTLGKDYSSNGNNWTPNNLSVTAGAGNDSLVDTPTSYGTGNSGGDVRGNYATLNPLANSGLTLSNGNLDFTSDSGNIDTCISTFAVSSGKWYWELSVTDFRIAIGIEPQGYYPVAGARTGFDSTGYAWWIDRQEKYHNGSSAAYGASTTTGDIIGVALDLDAGTLVFYKNNVSQGTAYSGITGTYLPAICDCSTVGAATGSLNFGQRPFAFPVSGFKALCDTNLPAPVVAKASSAFDVKLYTGNGSTQTISGLGFSPDLAWIKRRDSTGSHVLQDQVRGATAYLSSDLTSAENTNTANNWFRAFTNDGFTVAATTTGGTPTGEWNANSATYVAWTWDAGSSTVTNTAGSITSSVRANASAGFSIVTYTGTGANATVGHGLGVKPGLIIARTRDVVANWCVYHITTGAGQSLSLNSTAAASANTSRYQGVEPTSTVFSIGNTGDLNLSSSPCLAYCFAPVAGYSSFGSYTGNGSADGPFVYTGFRPRWVMIKSSSNAYYWIIYDAARDAYNAASKELFPNDSLAETVVPRDIDFLSNGFKLRNTGTTNNQSGATYIYAAFAENPFQYARAR